MLVAIAPSQERTVAGRDLEGSEFHCPLCESAVILKRGRVVVPHFAHTPGSDCPASEAEGPRHLQAKLVLAQQFTEAGYDVQLEETHLDVGRRVDVAVTFHDEGRVLRRIAVEVQDSAIQVETMKERVRLDKRLRYDATVWVFTHHRAKTLMGASPGEEVRIPAEMLWVVNRYRKGVHVIDASAPAMWKLTMSGVDREGESYQWYTEDGDPTGVDYPGRTLKTVKTIERWRVGFRVGATRSRFNEWAVHFMAD